MEDKNKERLYHENVQNESAFAKALSGGKENMTLEKRNHGRNNQNFRITLPRIAGEINFDCNFLIRLIFFF